MYEGSSTRYPSSLISKLVNTSSPIQSDIEHMPRMACVTHAVTDGSASPLSCQTWIPGRPAAWHFKRPVSNQEERSGLAGMHRAYEFHIDCCFIIRCMHNIAWKTGGHLLTFPQLHMTSGCWHQWESNVKLHLLHNNLKIKSNEEWSAC